MGTLIFILVMVLAVVGFNRYAAARRRREGILESEERVSLWEHLGKPKAAESLTWQSARPVVRDFSSYFESRTCEVCGQAPRQKYKSSVGGVMEFCGHHGHKHGPALLKHGYRLAFDADQQSRVEEVGP